MKTMEIIDIDEMLLKLPARRLQEVRDYVGFLLEKEKKRMAFEKKVLKAAKEPRTRYDSVDDAMKAILNAAED